MLRSRLIVLLSLIASSSYSQQLVKDINTVPGSQVRSYNIYEQECVKCGTQKIYFVGNDVEHGRELWVTLGFASGTHLVKDLNPGPDSGMQYTEMFCLNDILYFRSGGLMKTDGTEEGTVQLSSQFTNGITHLGDEIVFKDDKNLYASDGSPDDARLLFSFPQNDGEFTNTAIYGGFSHVYILLSRFSISTATATAYELWAYDGDEVTLVKEFVTGNTFGLGMVDAGGRLIFVANDGDSGQEFWISGGTEATTQLLLDAVPGPAGSSPSIIGSVSGLGILSASTGTWISGNPEPTKLLDETMTGVLDRGGVIFLNDYSRIIKAALGEEPVEVANDLRNVRPLGVDGSYNKAFYTVDDDEIGNEIFYVEQALEEEFKLLKDINPGPAGSYARAYVYQSLTSESLFIADDGVHGFELWKSNGLEPDTEMVIDIADNTADSNIGDVYVHNDKLYFLADDSGEGFYNRLWASDGTDAGTLPINESLHADLVFAPVGDNIITLSNTYRDITKTNVSSAVTSTIATQELGAFGGASQTRSAAIGNNALFYLSGQTPEGVDPGIELYMANPVTNEFRLVKDINPGFGSSYLANGLTGSVVGNKFVFEAQSENGYEPWVTDGTATGTFELGNLTTQDSSIPQLFTTVGSKVFFAIVKESQLQLWQTDGTVDGTSVVAGRDQVQALASYKNKLMFSEQSGEEIVLSLTDGTSAGTTEIKRFPAGSITQILVTGDKAFFIYDLSEVWITNGTADGTKKIGDGYGLFDYEAYLKATDGILFFAVGGKMYGTRGGEVVVVGDAKPADEIYKAGNYLYFVQNDLKYGRELFRLAIPQINEPETEEPEEPEEPNPTTGLEEDAMFSYVFPNPANENLFIRSNEPASFRILDSTGREIHTAAIAGVTKIDVSSYAAGMYFVVIKNAGQSRVTKFVVKR